jgi:hypothetical protein
MFTKSAAFQTLMRASLAGVKGFRVNVGWGILAVGYLSLLSGFQNFLREGVRITGSFGPEALGAATGLLLRAAIGGGIAIALVSSAIQFLLALRKST